MENKYTKTSSARVRIVQPTNFAQPHNLMKYSPPKIAPDHAGKMETSLALYLYPELVRIENVELPDGQVGISPGASEATAEWGQEIFEGFVGYVVRMVEEALQQVTAEEN